MSADTQEVCSGWWNKWQEWGVACQWDNTLYSKCALIYLVCFFGTAVSLCLCCQWTRPFKIFIGLFPSMQIWSWAPKETQNPFPSSRTNTEMTAVVTLLRLQSQFHPALDETLWVCCALSLARHSLSLSLCIWLPSVCLSRLCRFIVNQSYLLGALAKDLWHSVHSS